MLNLVKIWQDLHKIPEIGFQEFRTQKYLLKFLSSFEGIKTTSLETAILVEYSFGQGYYKLFRSDMDALPIQEETGVHFTSQRDGFMHACGHDIHMSILLGLIEKVVLEKPKRNLLFLFQPAEELVSGAQKIIDSEILKKYKISQAYALHIDAKLPLGWVSSKSGAIFSTSQEFDIDIEGSSTHIATPDLGRDALLGACRLVDKITKLSIKDTLMGIGKLSSGSARNIVSDFTKIYGTHRSSCDEQRKKMNTILKKIVLDFGRSNNLTTKIHFGESTIATKNNTKLLEYFRANLPTETIYKTAQMSFGAEDFGVFASNYPALLFWLGSGVSQYSLHSSKFLPNPDCIEKGIKIFYNLI